jgi:hypothetical protein
MQMESKKRPFSAFLNKRRTPENPICAITSPYKVDLASPQELLRFRPARDFMHLIRPYKRIIGSSYAQRRDEYFAVYPAHDLPKKESTKYLDNVTKIVNTDTLRRLDSENAQLKHKLIRTSSEACLALERLQSPKASLMSRHLQSTQRSVAQSYASLPRPKTTQTAGGRNRPLLTRGSMRSLRTAPQMGVSSRQTSRSFKP